MYRIACGVVLLLIACSPLRAQNAEIDERICPELNGKSFYFRMRNRILDFEEYFRSLENMVKAQTFNPEKRRPWTLQDARERWEVAKKQAQEDKEKCEPVKSLPELENAVPGVAKEFCSLRTQGLKSLRRCRTKRTALWHLHQEAPARACAAEER